MSLIYRWSYYIIFFVLIFLFFKTKHVEALGFTKYSNNPIIKNNPNLSWKSKHVAAPFVMFDSGIYKMWYAANSGSNWRIAYATSADGKNWLDYSMNPVLVPAMDGRENHVHTPRVIKDKDDHYFMYYTASPDDSTYFEIRIAESQDGINWTKLTGSKININQSWEHWGITVPAILKDNDLYRLWYDSYDGSKWRLGYATSNDGISWIKYQNNPLFLLEGNASGAFFVLKENNKIIGWRHGGNGGPYKIIQVESSDYINWSNKNYVIFPSNINGAFDKTFVAYPSVIKVDGKYYLYYSGYNGSNWQIGLAIQNTPTVIVPGFLGSWNKDAIIHNQSVSILDWQVPAFVKEYTGLINSLKNIGLEENNDFYVFPYDWRKSIDTTTNDLNDFLTQKIWTENPDMKVNLVGHSLGGVVARVYTQKHQEKIDKLLTVGAPHRGTVQTYKPLEAGVIDNDNSFLWLAQKIILLLNKTGLEPDRETIKNKFPVLTDLFPTFDFLKNSQGNLISNNTLSVKNNFLTNYNATFSNIYSNFRAFYGEKSTQTTQAGYNVEPANKIDNILGNYKDGKPKTAFYNYGDDSILTSSAREENDPDFQTLSSLNHGEIIYKSEAIKKIFDALDLAYQDNQIVEGTPTVLSPSLIFLIKSPAYMEVFYNGRRYQEENGLIVIPNAASGDYTLNVKGQEKGRYTVVIGKNSTNQTDTWSSIEGEITASPPTDQVDSFIFHFDKESAQPLEITSSSNNQFPFDEVILYLTDLNKTLNRNDITKAISNINTAKQFGKQYNSGRLKSSLSLAEQQLLAVRSAVGESNKPLILYAISKVENLADLYLNTYNSGVNARKLKTDLDNYRKITTSTENFLITKQQSGKNVTKNGIILTEIEARLDRIQTYLNTNKLTPAEFLLKTIGGLVKEVRSI